MSADRHVGAVEASDWYTRHAIQGVFNGFGRPPPNLMHPNQPYERIENKSILKSLRATVSAPLYGKLPLF